MEISLKQCYLDKLHYHSNLYPCWVASLTLAEWEIRKQQIGINIAAHSGQKIVRAPTKVEISLASFARLVEPCYKRILHVTSSSLIVKGNGGPFSSTNILYIHFFLFFFNLDITPCSNTYITY